MKIKSLLFVALTAFVLLLSSCGKYPGYKQSENGFYYKFYHQDNAAAKPKLDEILTLNIRYKAKIEGKDSVFFNSAELKKPFEVPLQKPAYKGDIFDALSMMHVGDSASFIINAMSFFTETAHYPMVPKGIDSTSMMTFDVKLLSSQTKEARTQAINAKNEKLRAAEGGKLQEVLARYHVTQKPSATGVYFIEVEAGSGPVITKGEFVQMNLTLTDASGKKVFSSVDVNRPVTMEYGKPFDTKGLDEALGQMRKGGKAKVIVPSDMGMGEQGKRDPASGVYIIEPYSPVVYDLEILDIRTKAQQEAAQKAQDAKSKKEADDAMKQESVLLKDYLNKNHITAKPTASGLYYIEKVKGNGMRATAGKKVKVEYTGRLLNGKVFDASANHKPAGPYEFVLGQGRVIAGWDEGIAMMNQGGKATLIVPSKLGYGSQQMGNDITPYSPLVFDVELVGVEK